VTFLQGGLSDVQSSNVMSGPPKIRVSFSSLLGGERKTISSKQPCLFHNTNAFATQSWLNITEKQSESITFLRHIPSVLQRWLGTNSVFLFQGVGHNGDCAPNLEKVVSMGN
jgi:hypothetical protein